MNQKIYRYLGLVLIIMSIIIGGQMLISAITGFIFSFKEGFEPFLLTVSLVSLIASLSILALGIFPGKYYYQFSKKEQKDNALIKTAAILKIIVILILIFSMFILPIIILGGLPGPADANDFGVAFSFAIFSGISLLIYLVGTALLIIHIVRQPKKNKKTLKKK